MASPFPVSKFKHGYKITFTKYASGTKRYPGTVSIDNGEIYVCQDELAGFKPREMFGYKYGYLISRVDRDSYRNSETIANVEFVTRDIEDVVAGDIICNTEYHRRILERVGDVVFMSGTYGIDREIPKIPSNVYTENIRWFIENGYRLKEDNIEESVVELTLEEIASQLGIDSKSLRIKEKDVITPEDVPF